MSVKLLSEFGSCQTHRGVLCYFFLLCKCGLKGKLLSLPLFSSDGPA